MSAKDLTYRVGVDASDAVGGLKKLEGAVRQTMRTVDDELEDGATAGEKLAASLDRVAAQAKEDFASAAIAAERMGQALRDAGSDLDVADVLPTLQRMGLSMDEITQEADKLAVSLKQLDDVRATGAADLDAMAPGLAAKLDDVSKSADSSKSALANMVGNSAQDIGQLGGVAGSAGVAIGQMAEYFADAAFAGEGLSSVLKSFATVAGPIAAISVATSVLSTVMGRMNAERAFRADLVEKFSDALDDGVDSAQAMYDVLAETGKLDFSTMGGGILGLGAKTADLVPIFEQLGFKTEEWLALLDDPRGAAEKFGRQAEALGFEQLDLQVLLTQAAEGLDQYADAQEQAALAEEQRKEILAGLNASGKLTTEQQEEQAKATEEAAAAAEEAAQAARDHAEAVKAQEVAVAGANRELLDMTSTFAEMDRRGSAIAALFDLGNAPLDAAAATRDLATAIGELGDTADDLDLSGIVDALDGLRPEIQAKVSEAFAAGGPEAAKAVADDYVAQVVASLGGKLTTEQVTELLGLTNLEATVAVALDMSTAARVRSMLDVLTGVAGTSPLTASIALALDAGTISPEAAEVLVRAQLGQAKVSLPTDVTPPSPEAVAEAGAFVTAQASGSPAAIPTTLDPTGAEAGAQGFAAADHPPATIPLEGDKQPAEDERDDFVDETERTKPIIDIRGETKEALGLLVALKIYAALLAPVVTVTANTTPAMLALAGVAAQRPRVPVEAYLAEYPSASEIQQRIGRPRIPVDIVVGSSIRITGVRE